MVTVYFDTDSAALTKDTKSILADAIRQVKQAGFGNVSVDGYTDAAGNWLYNNLLSRLRTRAVAGYLSDNGGIVSDQAWYGERSPAASNASRTGKAKNRRVEVLVTY
jgi:outer membrane protein OmpA-like peptidoglycan-associated protein